MTGAKVLVSGHTATYSAGSGRLIEAFGELKEDWIPTLRIQRVLIVGGEVLFDVDAGHVDRAVEDEVDTVNLSTSMS
jgi:hypothetical protein